MLNQHCNFCFSRKNMYYFSISSICHVKSCQVYLATRSVLLLQNSEFILSMSQAHGYSAMQTEFGILAARDNLIQPGASSSGEIIFGMFIAVYFSIEFVHAKR